MSMDSTQTYLIITILSGVFQAVSHIEIVFNSLPFYGLPTISMVKHQDYLYVMILKAVFTLAKVVNKNA
jgi:hypothetical protein